MDFALTTVLLIFLLLPGLVFRRFYYTEEFSKEYFKESIPSFFLSVAVPSTVINILGWQIGKTWYRFDTTTLGILFSGTDDPSKIKEAFDSLYNYISPILWYFLLLCVLAFIFGSLSKAIVRNSKLDRRFKLFRYQNEWHYIFSGEILDFPKVSGEARDIDFTFIDALVDTDEGTIIYKGVLEDYILSKDGGMDRIVLTDVKRRFFKDDGKEERNYTLPGQFLVIPFSKILNIHLTYYNVETTEEELRELIAEPANNMDTTQSIEMIISTNPDSTKS
jgi:hypothetical protein